MALWEGTPVFEKKNQKETFIYIYIYVYINTLLKHKKHRFQ